MSNFFRTKNNIFSVNKKKYLLNFLTPASSGTNYWDSPPKSEPNKRQFARVLLQIHQLVFFMNLFKIDMRGKNFLDVGTGNGLIPRLVDEFFQVKNSYGIDPYTDGEHKTSWQHHNQENFLNKIKNFFFDKKKNIFCLDYQKYKNLLKFEQHQFKSHQIKIKKIKRKSTYKFKKISIDRAYKLNTKFDFIYCKAFEHINNIEDFLLNVSKNLNKGGIFYLKHRSFFSYLGAHRYSSTSIPWGHVLLKEKEYKNYCNKFHKSRSKEMIKFYYNDLTYPRVTISDIVKASSRRGLNSKCIIYEQNIYQNQINRYIPSIKNFWKIVRKNFPNLSNEELLSGMTHIILEKK